MPNRRPHDHFSASLFKVEIEGVTQAAFTSMDGLEVEVDVALYADGDDLVIRKRPGRIHYNNLVLKRGYVELDDLWLWFKAVLDGKVERKAGSVILCDDAGNEVHRYNFFEGWPCKWKGFTFDARSSDTLVEELHIVVEKIERG